jgi:hypothetical protein
MIATLPAVIFPPSAIEKWPQWQFFPSCELDASLLAHRLDFAGLPSIRPGADANRCRPRSNASFSDKSEPHRAG